MTVIQDLRSQTPKRSTTRSLSSVKRIARHHSATTSGDFWSFWNNRWKGLGWLTGGYHEIILRDGTVQVCYEPNMVTNGVGNHNSDTYHICVVGNGSFTEAQEKAFEERCRLAMQRFNIPVELVLGHKEFRGAATACPGISMDTVRYRLKKKNVVAAKKVEDDKLNLSGYQWGELEKNIESLLKEKVITSQDWLAKARNKSLTVSELAWLNNVILQRLR